MEINYSGDLNNKHLNNELLHVHYSWDLKSKHLNSILSEPFKIGVYMTGFQMIFDIMATMCPDFKWLGFWISDSIWNLDHLQPNLFLIIRNPGYSGFQIPTAFRCQLFKWGLNTGPFSDQTTFSFQIHTRLVQCSDPHCN